MDAIKFVPVTIRGRQTMEVGRVGDQQVGFITKWWNTRTDRHPWQVFRYKGTQKLNNGQTVACSEYVTCFYGADAKKEARAELKSLWENGDCVPVSI